jgi:hypothetical protein
MAGGGIAGSWFDCGGCPYTACIIYHVVYHVGPCISPSGACLPPPTSLGCMAYWCSSCRAAIFGNECAFFAAPTGLAVHPGCELRNREALLRQCTGTLEVSLDELPALATFKGPKKGLETLLGESAKSHEVKKAKE